MDFRFTTQEEEFREEVKTFISENLPNGASDGGEWGTPAEDDTVANAFVQKLTERRWHVLAWPEQYGSHGAGHMQQLVYNETMAYLQAPNGGVWAGVSLVGPVLMIHGNEDQRNRFLPGIANATTRWCQGFSEPGAGSDLASLQTRAVQDGDEFVVNGQKIWTSGAQFADWCILLARTDPDAPKHRGISYFLVDMKSPGVTVRPLTSMNGGQPFNEMFFEDVRVPRENLLGDLNRGWYMAATTLDFERSGIGTVASAHRTWDNAAEYATNVGLAHSTGLAASALRLEMLDRRVEIEVGRGLAYRVATMQARGLVPNHESSASKLFSSELHQRLANTELRVVGMIGTLMPESHRAVLRGRVADRYLFAVQETIQAGTSEVQRNIMATRGLGLPRA